MPEPLEHALAVARPELLVTTLLQHALAAARHALAAVHPELSDDNLDLGEVDHQTHLTLLIAFHLVDLDKLLREYRDVVETQWRSYDDKLPF